MERTAVSAEEVGRARFGGDADCGGTLLRRMAAAAKDCGWSDGWEDNERPAACLTCYPAIFVPVQLPITYIWRAYYHHIALRARAPLIQLHLISALANGVASSVSRAYIMLRVPRVHVERRLAAHRLPALRGGDCAGEPSRS